MRHTRDSPSGWEDLCKQAQNAMRQAWEQLSKDPLDPSTPNRQHRLQGVLSSREIGGKELPQWQYEITGAARIWYCPDVTKRIVHITLASCGHPKETE